MDKSLIGNILKNYNDCSSFVKQKVSHYFHKIIILDHRYWNNLNLFNSFQKKKKPQNLKTTKNPGLNLPAEMKLTDHRVNKGTGGSPVASVIATVLKSRKRPRRVQRGNNRKKIM